MRLGLTALVAGFLVALLVAGFPASAANQTIAAQPSNAGWNPSSVSISPGESVTWTNPPSGFHNVCVAPAGEAASQCTSSNDEYRSGNATQAWPAQGYSHVFANAGTYAFE